LGFDDEIEGAFRLDCVSRLAIIGREDSHHSTAFAGRRLFDGIANREFGHRSFLSFARTSSVATPANNGYAINLSCTQTFNGFAHVLPRELQFHSIQTARVAFQPRRVQAASLGTPILLAG
jgi:hypothetical protein